MKRKRKQQEPEVSVPETPPGPPRCWCCEGDTDRPGVMRVVSRGDRAGETVGPLCDDCESFMERNVLVEAIDVAKL